MSASGKIRLLAAACALVLAMGPQGRVAARPDFSLHPWARQTYNTK